MHRRSIGAMALLAVVALAASPPRDIAAADAPELAVEMEVPSYALEHQVQDVVMNPVDLEISLELLEHLATPEVVADGVSTRAPAVPVVAVRGSAPGDIHAFGELMARRDDYMTRRPPALPPSLLR